MRTKWIKISKWFVGIVVGIFLLISLLIYLFKDEIIQYVVQEVNKHLQVKVQVAKIDLTFWATFPNVSVDFDEVLINDSYPNARKTDTLLYSEKIRFKFNPIDLWNEKYDVKEITIAPGALQIKMDEQGLGNYNILKPSSDTTESSSFKLNLKSVKLNEIRFLYANKKTQQTYKTKVHHLKLHGNFSEEEFTLAAQSELQIEQIQSGKVNLLQHKKAQFDLQLFVAPSKHILEIPKATIYISDLPFNLFLKSDSSAFDLNVKAQNIGLEELANTLNADQNKEFKRIQGKGKVEFDLDVHGSNVSNEAATSSCKFAITNGSLREPSQSLFFSGINLRGFFTNKGGLEKSYLDISTFQFQSPTGPFSGKLKVSQFDHPRYQGALKGSLDLRNVHTLFSIPFVEEITGNLKINSDFDIQNQAEIGENQWDVKTCNAAISLDQIDARIENDSRDFKNLRGNIVIQKDAAVLDGISLKIGSSDIAVNGSFSQLVPYLQGTGNLLADVDVSSQFIDSKDLSSNSVQVEKSRLEPEKKFVIPNDIDANLSVQLAQLNYGNQVFKNIQSNLSLRNRMLDFKQLSLENAGASMNGKLQIEEIYPEYIQLSCVITSPSISFKNLFKTWNNFDQEVIKEQNISGNAAVEMTFDAPFDLRTGIVKKEIKSKIHLKITDGKLSQVEAFKSITESLKKPAIRAILKRENIQNLEKNLSNLSFKTLENTLLIQNGKLEIPWMKIENNALNMSVYGKHGFDNQIDYHFEFRFRELLQAQKDNEFGRVEDDGSGFLIFMHMYGDLNNPIIEWDEAAKKKSVQENREAAKKEALSILKSEFGFKSKDTTIQQYERIQKPREEIEMDFGTKVGDDPIETKKEKERKNRIFKDIEKLKKEKNVEFEFE